MVTASGAHTGLGVVSVLISQIGKSQDSWELNTTVHRKILPK